MRMRRKAHEGDRKFVTRHFFSVDRGAYYNGHKWDGMGDIKWEWGEKVKNNLNFYDLKLSLEFISTSLLLQFSRISCRFYHECLFD